MPKLMLEPEVLEITKLSRNALRRLYQNDLFPRPIIKLGRLNRWRRADVEDFLKGAADKSEKIEA